MTELFNCAVLLFVGLFFLAFLRGLGKWGVLLFAFACALVSGVTMAEWSGQSEKVPMVFILAGLGVLVLWVLDKVIAGLLFGADSVLSFWRKVRK